MELTILDTETTGLGTPSGVVEIAWLRLDNDLNVVSEFRSLVNPQRDIEPGAFAIHGISQADVADAPTMAQIAADIDWPVNLCGHNCVTGDHEILTTEGWVRLDAITADTVKAAIWGPEGTITFSDSLVVRKPYTGDLLEYDSTFHCGVYTPEHKAVYCSSATLNRYKTLEWKTTTLERLSKLAPNSILVPSSGNLRVERIHDVPDALIQLLEAVRADAHISKAGTSVRFNLKKVRKIDRITGILNSLGLRYSIRDRVTDKDVKILDILSHHYRSWVVSMLGTGTRKAAGPKFLELDNHQREVWLSELEFWDGSKQIPGLANSKQQILLHTANAEEAEWVQIIACLSGRTSRVVHGISNTRGFSRPDGILSKVTIRANSYVKTLYAPKPLYFSGTVYCLTTATGAFMVRRKGAVWVTGNCSFDARMIHPYIVPASKLCTLSLARQYLKTSNHKLSTLKQELGLSNQVSHSALGDCYTTLELLKHILPLTGRTLEQVVVASNTPRVVSTMPFGKFKGTKMVQVPAAYRAWLLEQPELPAELRYTLELYRNI